MKTLICTFATPEIAEYTQHTIPRMLDFATKNEYDFLVGTKMYKNKHPSWGKIQLILENSSKYDLILFLDADIWINNFSIKIEGLLDKDKYIGICENGLNGGKLLNCGSLLVRTDQLGNEFAQTSNVLNFFTKVWQTTSNDWQGFWEQDIINDFYELNYQGEQDLIQILPMRTLNSWWQDSPLNMPGNFCYHLMGRSLEDKLTEIYKLI